MRGELDAAANRYRFTGMERDEETGLAQHGARYYAGWLGRWTAADPSGLKGGINLYEYGRGAPVNLVDPSGEAPCAPDDLNCGEEGSDYSSNLGTGATEEWEAEYPEPPPDPLHDAAVLHGTLEGRLQTLQQEIVELDASRRHGSPTRFWSLDHYFPEEALQARGAELHGYIRQGLAEVDANDWAHSAGLERAIENGLIKNRSDQEYFFKVSERARTGVITEWAVLRAVEMALSLTPSKGVGGGGILFARAPQSSSAALKALNEGATASGITGEYVNVIESMSKRAIAFQEPVSGGIQAGTSFLRNNVKFDAVDRIRKVLIDAKGPGYGAFVNKEGKFYEWFRGSRALVDQARRQLKAAGGMKVEWVFAEEAAMKATRILFDKEEIYGITLRLVRP